MLIIVKDGPPPTPIWNDLRIGEAGEAGDGSVLYRINAFQWMWFANSYNTEVHAWPPNTAVKLVRIFKTATFQ